MFKNTSIRLSEKHQKRLDRLAEHLRAVTHSSRKSRSVAIAYLIEHAVQPDGRPTWLAMGLGSSDMPDAYSVIMKMADEPEVEDEPEVDYHDWP